MKNKLLWHHDHRVLIERRFSILRTIIAILISLAIAFLLILSVSDNPVDDFITLIIGPLRNINNVTTIFTKMIPLLFTGTAICLVNKCGQLNIAAEGSFFAGAVAATIVGIIPGIPSVLHIPLCFLAAMFAGAIFMGVPAFLHVKYKAITIVSSLMINYVALYLGLYIILNPLRDASAGFEASYKYSESARLPKIFGSSRIHLGLIIGLLVVFIGYFILYQTKFGLQVRTIGLNSKFASYSGMPVGKTIFKISCIAGMMAGLGGACETLGNYPRFVYTGFTNHGWDGVMLAVLCHNKPQFMPLASIFLAYIRTSADALNFSSNIPPEIVNIIQGIIIIFVASERFLSNWEHKAIVKNATNELKALGDRQKCYHK
jgi:simple sugar transport system permease protein